MLNNKMCDKTRVFSVTICIKKFMMCVMISQGDPILLQHVSKMYTSEFSFNSNKMIPIV